MSNILIFDTSVATTNLGDLIISDSVYTNLLEMFPEGRFFNTTTHEVIGKLTYRLHQNSKYSFVAGTNLLSSNMNFYNQWKVNLLDGIFLKDIVLMGVGWWQYQKSPNLYTRLLYKRLLSSTYVHSVRDGYTVQKLNEAGINNVLNTGCPTIWKLTQEHCKLIPQNKANSVVFTLTDYNKNIGSDMRLMDILKKSYDFVYFWPQGSNDLEYFSDLGGGAEVLSPTLKGYDELLARNGDIDYVGTRLHAGIRAMQFKKRSIILTVDNRALEKAKDINLPVVERSNLCELQARIDGKWDTKLNIDFNAIDTWRSQFLE